MPLVSSCKFTDKKKSQSLMHFFKNLTNSWACHGSCPILHTAICKGRKSGLGFEKTKGLFAQVAEHRREW